jgi:hypothetical protein
MLLLGQRQLILSRVPEVDPTSLRKRETIEEISKALNVSTRLQDMAPKQKQTLLEWALSHLQSYNMFNSRLLH